MIYLTNFFGDGAGSLYEREELLAYSSHLMYVGRKIWNIYIYNKSALVPLLRPMRQRQMKRNFPMYNYWTAKGIRQCHQTKILSAKNMTTAEKNCARKNHARLFGILLYQKTLGAIYKKGQPCAWARLRHGVLRHVFCRYVCRIYRNRHNSRKHRDFQP